MKRLKMLLAAASALLVVVTAADAATLKWGAARDIDSLDPYSFGSTFTLAFLNHTPCRTDKVVVFNQRFFLIVLFW